MVESPGSVPLRTLPYNHVSETYDSGKLFGSDTVFPRALAKFARKSQEKSF